MNRVFVEKQSEFNAQARELLHDLRDNLNIHHLEDVRVVQRYDVDGLSDEQFAEATRLILSEPQVEKAYDSLSVADDETAFAVEYLPGQYDQRADSAAQCVQILTQGSKPLVASARIIILKGLITPEELFQVKSYTINAVDSREASMEVPQTLEIPADRPDDVEILDGFTTASEDDLRAKRDQLGLAMSPEDLIFTQTYFRDEEDRNPTITEIKMLDTYWSDHCRHTTFATKIDSVEFESDDVIAETYAKYQETREQVYGADTERPETLMDIALIAMKELRQTGELDNVEVSEEINAASIVVPVEITNHKSQITNTTTEEWLVMFKNETHNHPTEIEPFGGAATCLGGCIRDPLSGRSYVYQAMRVTGAADPRTPFSETLPGKLPQRKICKEAAHGYSSYGNQIGLATGQVAEVYHPNYVAKRMEIGAVVAAAPKKNVFRGSPATGDVILLIGGRTGRDGVGGATGSSKEHTDTALDNSAEVQKGNPPTERKVQRLFRNPELAAKIKICNDFGAGGVSVAIGEIAPSLDINLDAVPKKYDGLDGTELAISESQERMAICVDPSTIDYFKAECDKENLECSYVADVTDTGRLVIKWRGKDIVNFSRAFLDTNGVTLSTSIKVNAVESNSSLGCQEKTGDSLKDRFAATLADLNTSSQKGLGEMFDGSIGAGTVLNPFGGKNQLTPTDAMVAKIPLMEGDTTTCTHMAWGFNPNIASWSPFHGALYAVTESVCRVVASGAHISDIRLTLQEYFEKLGTDPARWGKPFSALLGAFLAQHELRLGAIGGKDSMSGSFNDIDVPPTLVSFAVAPGKTTLAVSPEFKQTGSNISLIQIPRDDQNVPDFQRLMEVADILYAENAAGNILSIHSLAEGGIAAGVAKMAFGNSIGADLSIDASELFNERYISFLVEASNRLVDSLNAQSIGHTTDEKSIKVAGETLPLDDLLNAWTAPLESTYPTQVTSPHQELETFSHQGPAEPKKSTGNWQLITGNSQPRVVVPTFPGTNCEYDTVKAFNQAGADASALIFKNLTSAHVEDSLRELAEQIKQSQILMLPGGFSAGDEPDGSGKFIATVLRNPMITDAVMDLIKNRDGLVLGICNGFQALIKTGLVPYGEIRPPVEGAPTLTFNDIGRHIACYATTRIASTKSPWLANCKVGDLHNIPFSHGEGKFYAAEEEIKQLAANGQIATQYTDLDGNPSMEVAWNPNGSLYAIEGITSPCGRVLGKMGHTERRGESIAKNLPGNKYQPLFKAGIAYFE